MPHETVGGKKVRVGLISIVIVHWNTPELLRNCLASICENAPTSLLDTVVVDCDSHNTCASEVVDQFEHVQLVQLPQNRGYAAGCNAGMDAVSGETVLFLNADTELLPGAVDRIADCFGLNPRVGLVAPLLLNPDLSLQSSGYRFPGVVNVVCDLLPVPDRIAASSLNGRIDPGSACLPYAVDYALGAALAVRRVALIELGGWDETYDMYSEEIELAQRLDRAGWRRLIEPRARIVHVGGASTGQRADAMTAALWRSRGKYHRRWSSGSKRRALQGAVNALSRIGRERASGRTVREAFGSGLEQ